MAGLPCPDPMTPRRSISRKLNLILLVCVVCALMLAGVSLVLLDLRTQARGIEQDLIAQADIVGLASLGALTFDDAKAGSDNLRVLRSNAGIVSAALYRADGRRFAGYTTGGNEPPGLLPMGRPEATMDWSLVRVVRRIPGTPSPGYVYVEAQHELASSALEHVAVLALILGVSLGFAVLLARRLLRPIVGPILSVSQVAREIRRGDYQLRADETSDDEIGELVDAFNAMLDELERRAQALQQREAQLRESNDAKDRFIATLAHELRNPLAPIRTGLDILQFDQGRTAVSTRARETMHRQLVHLIRLIDDLLDISRINNGKIHLSRARLRLADVIESALEQARPVVEAGSHKLAVEVHDDGIEVDGDATRLAQALGNLLNNAAKYTPRGGTITLRMRREGASAVVEVEDTGLGIPTGMAEKIFDMFAQVNRTEERTMGGLGIGLALVRSLVQLHGGTVTASSPGEGLGSTFTVRLPCLDARQAPAATAAPEPAAQQPAGARAGHRVLVVDDNVDAAETLAAVLQMVGYEARSVHYPEAVFEAAAAFAPHAILLDIGMPGLSGHELARRLRQDARFARTVLVAVTGWGTEADRERSRLAGFDGHLTKPVEARDVVMALRTLSGQPQSSSQPAA